MKKSPFYLAIPAFCLLVLLTSCSNYGNKISIAGTKGEVFYKDSATETDAGNLGNFLKQDGFFGNTKEASVQVDKKNGTYTVRFVYDKDYYEKTPDLEGFFKDYTNKISQQVFHGEKVDIALSDKYFKDFKNIPYSGNSGGAPATP